MTPTFQILFISGLIFFAIGVLYSFYMAFYQLWCILITERSKQGQVIKTNNMPKNLYAQFHYSDNWVKVRFDSNKIFIKNENRKPFFNDIISQASKAIWQNLVNRTEKKY